MVMNRENQESSDGKGEDMQKGSSLLDAGNRQEADADDDCKFYPSPLENSSRSKFRRSHGGVFGRNKTSASNNSGRRPPQPSNQRNS